MPRMISHEEYLKKVEKITANGYEIISEYKGVSKTISIRHKCGNVFEANAGEFSKGNKKCRKCFPKKGNNVKKTHEQFLKEVYDLVGEEYTVLGKYTRSGDKLIIKHNVCDYEWNVTPNSFTNRGNRCPRCGGNERKHKLQYNKKRTQRKLFISFLGQKI